MSSNLFTYHAPIPHQDGPVHLVRFTGRSELKDLHRALSALLKGRVRAGRNGDFGSCVEHEARATAIVTQIEAEMASHGYSDREVETFVANAKHAVSVAFRDWEEAYTVNVACKLSAREAHPAWFGQEQPTEPLGKLREALMFLRWAIEAGQERFAFQQRMEAVSWSQDLQRQMERAGCGPEEIAEAMWGAWQRE